MTMINPENERALFAPLDVENRCGDLDPVSYIGREDYDLSDEQMDEIEAALWSHITPNIGVDNQGIVVAQIPWNSEFAAFGRTSERMHYETEDYDLHKGMIPYENRSVFIYTIDTESGVIAHVKRVVLAKSLEEIEASGTTGLEIVDDRILSSGDEHASLDEILSYHDIDRIDQCLNVASNHKMKRRGVDKEKPYTLASYNAVFQMMREYGSHSVLAYLNTNAIRSFASFGLEYELLGGREFHVPNNSYDKNKAGSSEYEYDYIAVYIPESTSNVKLFEDLGAMIPSTNAQKISIAQ